MEESAKERLIDEVTRLSEDNDMYAIYSEVTKQELEYNTLMDDARTQGIERGIAQGERQQKLIIAKKMIENNIEIEMILRITGLTIEEIKEL